MVTVVVPDKPPMWPPMSLAWMTTRYSSLISRSIPWRATFMVAADGDSSEPISAIINMTVGQSNKKKKNVQTCTRAPCWRILCGTVVFKYSVVLQLRWTWLSRSLCRNQLCLFLERLFLCRHLYADWVWIMLSVLYNLAYCMQNGRYWLSHGSAYKKSSAQAYRHNPLRKQRPCKIIKWI